MNEILSVEKLETIIRDVLFTDEEMTGERPPDYAVIAPAITASFGFHPDRLKKHRKEIIAMLMELPDPFMASKGGGWTFLNACIDKNGDQWTDLHKWVETLVALGIAIGRVKFCLPKELWVVFPGGMPYFTVLDHTEN